MVSTILSNHLKKWAVKLSLLAIRKVGSIQQPGSISTAYGKKNKDLAKYVPLIVMGLFVRALTTHPFPMPNYLNSMLIF